jgi:hypothetical protein
VSDETNNDEKIAANDEPEQSAMKNETAEQIQDEQMPNEAELMEDWTLSKKSSQSKQIIASKGRRQ